MALCCTALRETLRLAGGIALTGDRTSTISREGLDKQINTHLRTSAKELSARVGLELGAVENSVVRYTASIHSQATESDFPWEVPEEDYTFDEIPPQFVGPVARVNNAQRSLRFSSYYTAPNVARTAAVNSSISTSLSMQYLYRELWDAHPSVVAMYTGYETGSMRLYPGQDPAEVLTDYDPRLRGWYRSALRTESSVIQTSPYIDAFGLGWLITLAQPVLSPSSVSATAVGVAGVDVTIRTLQRSILSVGFFSEQSSASMIQFDGRVVADPFWDADADAVRAYAAADNAQTVQDELDILDSFVAPNFFDVHPGVSRALWESIRDPQGGIKTLQYSRDGEVYILARSFVPVHPLDDPTLTPAEASAAAATFQPQYVITVEAKRADVHATLDDMAERISSGTGTLIGIAAGVCVATLAIVLGVLYWTSRSVTSPLKGMMEVARAITSSAEIGVASGDIQERTANIKETDDEIGAFAGHFKRMVVGLDNKEVTRTRAAEAVPNKLFRTLAPCEVGVQAPPRAERLPWEDGFRALDIPTE